MNAPISIRLDEDVRAALEAEAKIQGRPLATYLRQIAAAEAARLKRQRIRAASAAVGRHVAMSDAAKSFVDAWGTPLSEGLASEGLASEGLASEGLASDGPSGG